MSRHPAATSAVSQFLKEESGGMTVFSLFMLTTCLIIGGLALDTARLHDTMTLMQNTADNAAHAAIISRPDMSEAEAKLEAVAYAERNMPTEMHGFVLNVTNIEFGSWNGETFSFAPEPGATDAVRVRVSRNTESNNPLETFLLRFAGFEEWEVTRTSTMLNADQHCLREGFVSETFVDMQSNNSFVKGFCIHSNDRVKISSGNFFETGVSVTMPHPSEIELPQSGFGSNSGLEDALDSNRYNIRLLGRLDEIIAGLTTPGSRYIPSYITNSTVLQIGRRNISSTSVTTGRIHRVNCSGNQSLTIENNTVLRNVVIVTNCKVAFGNGAILENVVIATTNTDARSFNGPNGVSVGRNDNCGTGGGAQLLTLGGMDFASGLRVFGGQLIARGNIGFTADAGGIEGASFVASGTISGTSNMSLEGCDGQGMEDNFREAYARLVE